MEKLNVIKIWQFRILDLNYLFCEFAAIGPYANNLCDRTACYMCIMRLLKKKMTLILGMLGYYLLKLLTYS